MRLFRIAAISLLFLQAHAAATPKDDKKEEEIIKPCTLKSPNTGSFFDLNPLHIAPLDPDSKAGKEKPESWHARGYDYGANFTINFCGPVVEDLHDVVGIRESMWRNVSAYYVKDGKTFSIGQQKDEMIIRGRKLVLNYTDGSPCPAHATKRELTPPPTHDIHPRSTKPRVEAVNTNYRTSATRPGTSPQKNTQPGLVALANERRKSSIFSLLCERDPLAAKASVSFVGSSDDDCTYFFELRSSAACPSVNQEKQQVGPSAVFGLIFGVAFLVYLIGGIAYQRAVLHQRGWRQLPNYAFWAGIFGFITDMVVIVFYSCITCCRRRGKGFNQVEGPNGHIPGRRGPLVEDENRIIDNLDEEWDD